MPSHKSFKDEIVELKKRRIVNEARKLFFERGFAGTTLDAIVEAMQVTKPFVYSYYRGKNEILAEICESGVRAFLSATRECLASDLPPVAKLTRLVSNLTEIIVAEQLNIAIYLREEKHLLPADSARINELRSLFDQELADLLEEGMREGAFEHEDSHITALLVAGMIMWIGIWYRPDGRLNMEEIKNIVTRKVLGSVGVDSKLIPAPLSLPRPAERPSTDRQTQTRKI